MKADTWSRALRNLAASPFIWSMLIPTVFSDLCLEVYHRVCFPLYGIPYVKRSEYIRIMDRARLPYLSAWEKFNCLYCGYVNGWLHYASAVAGETERYWCAIKHLEDRGYRPAAHEQSFAAYGDEHALRGEMALPTKETPATIDI